jgi:hypothetical protein
MGRVSLLPLGVAMPADQPRSGLRALLGADDQVWPLLGLSLPKAMAMNACQFASDAPAPRDFAVLVNICAMNARGGENPANFCKLNLTQNYVRLN